MQVCYWWGLIYVWRVIGVGTDDTPFSCLYLHVDILFVSVSLWCIVCGWAKSSFVLLWRGDHCPTDLLILWAASPLWAPQFWRQTNFPPSLPCVMLSIIDTICCRVRAYEFSCICVCACVCLCVRACVCDSVDGCSWVSWKDHGGSWLKMCVSSFWKIPIVYLSLLYLWEIVFRSKVKIRKNDRHTMGRKKERTKKLNNVLFFFKRSFKF